MNIRPLFLCAAILLAQNIAYSAPAVDDSDLSGAPRAAAALTNLNSEGRRETRALVFALKESYAPLIQATNAVTGTLLLQDRSGKDVPARLAKARLVGPGAPDGWFETDAAGRFAIPLGSPLSGSYQVRVSLDNAYWAFYNPNAGAYYEWASPSFTLAAGTGLDLGALRPEAGSENAKLGVLHLTYLKALDFLGANADIQWWTTELVVNYPGSGDFFSPQTFSMDLTNPVAWDVVLHELGHAVMQGAMQADGAGGSHKIDECYSPALAWSEGWATFFAAAVNLSLDDADAKFEYLVPRRAPIRIENVPADVCAGEANEWRVAAGLWDLIDTHNDGGDQFSMPFKRLWQSLRGQSMGSLSSAWALIAKDLNPVERQAAEKALIYNTVLPPRPGLAFFPPRTPADWAEPR